MNTVFKKNIGDGNKWSAGRGRPRLDLMDGMKVDMGNRGMKPLYMKE